MTATGPFWETIPLREMSDEQWESLCDGCARCCLHKLQDEDTELIHYTSIACKLLDQEGCHCTRYPERQKLVPDCVVLSPSYSDTLSWLPESCAYRLLDEGKPLPDWHPLITGRNESVHEAGISVRGRVVSEEGIHDDDFQDFVIDWIPVTRYE